MALTIVFVSFHISVSYHAKISKYNTHSTWASQWLTFTYISVCIILIVITMCVFFPLTPPTWSHHFRTTP